MDGPAIEPPWVYNSLINLSGDNPKKALDRK
jgi:hypothetical protein